VPTPIHIDVGYSSKDRNTISHLGKAIEMADKASEDTHLLSRISQNSNPIRFSCFKPMEYPVLWM
jgi:hypothetical protein